MYAGSLYFKEATGWSIYISSCIVLSVTAVYVILGKEVVHIDWYGPEERFLRTTVRSWTRLRRIRTTVSTTTATATTTTTTIATTTITTATTTATTTTTTIITTVITATTTIITWELGYIEYRAEYWYSARYSVYWVSSLKIVHLLQQ